jgi:hypothetical protein
MNKEQILIKEDDNIIKFDPNRKALSFGGRDGDDNWLRNLKPGTIFLARDNQTPKELSLMKYLLIEHKDVSSNLLLALQKGEQVDIWVSTLEFSRRMKMVEILGEVEVTLKSEEETEAEDE